MTLSAALAITGVILLVIGLPTGLWYVLGGDKVPAWVKMSILAGFGFLAAAAWSGVTA